MKRVYQAANSIEAHMIVHLLEQAGVEAHVQGEHLQSGAGELPVGLVAVAVPDEDVEAARAVITEWESRSTPGSREASPPPKYAPMLSFLVGAMLSGGIVWALYNGPHEAREFDRNGDGSADERWLRSSDGSDRFEKDRNFDGRVDEISTYTESGDQSTAAIDDDFDGVMDRVQRYHNGELQSHSVDWDHDGAVDQRGNYELGALRSVEYLDRVTGRVVKRVTYAGMKQQRVELDLDGDGQWDRSYAVDRHDEPIIEGAAEE